MAVMTITKTSSPGSVWKPSDLFPSGTVLAMQNSGKIFIKVYPRADKGIINTTLLRIDDSSFYPCDDSAYRGLFFREVKAELKLEL